MQYFSTQTVFTRKEYTESYSPTIYVKLHCNRMYKSNLSFYIYLYRDIWWLRPGCTWFFSPLAQGGVPLLLLCSLSRRQAFDLSGIRDSILLSKSI